MAESESAERSSTSQNLLRSASDVLKSKVYKTMTFKDLSLDQYRFLLFVALVVNLTFLILQVARFAYLLVYSSLGEDKGLFLVILAFILTSLNSAILVRLMVAPTPSYAVACMGIILVQEAIFIAQTALYYNLAKGEDYIIALSALFLILQLVSVVVVYRFWELVLFNYDDSSWEIGTPSSGNLSDVNLDGLSRPSTGLPPTKATKVKSQLHIDHDF